ncbi:arylsulfatase [Puniceicoccales bacterium CK1056]|uniref:Arylsulfatase n=1 Tax=Oceanipulchritudo coccoides TaxID=2706888 RepID=A0A6B2M032_9BACT|nr:arylsulfatase [Oceanipulchritudo coccoides]NDV62063.1 arylsulfatase [Oceanipulchritudo coccoides]
MKLFSQPLVRHVLLTLLLPLLTFQVLAGKPNVIIVITDDQGYGDLGCHGNRILETPAMDALHAESVRLTDYHVSPTCAPTRGALMSGHYTNRAGPWHTIMGRSFLRPESTTLGEVFLENGYRTGLFGKWHLGDNYPYRPIDRGFGEVVSHGGGGVGQTPDHWDNAYFDDTYLHNGIPEKYEGYCTDVYFREAKRFISESVEAKKPFLAYISTNAPHSPSHVPDNYWKPYVGKVPSEKEAIFYGMIANIDENLGQLRQFLEDEGVAKNTIFIFTTDNGTASGKAIYNAGMRGQKGSQYDGGHRVPLFLRWPDGGLTQPRDIDQLTAHIDILPTLIELCGLKAPMDYSFDGRSLAPLLFETPTPWPERTLITDSQRVKDPIKWRQSATMTKRWRLIDGKELYDIKLDPAQKNDIAAEHPKVVSCLRMEYDAWWESVSTLFDKETRIVVGNDAENPAKLTCHDWITTDEVTPWHQAYIREGKPGTGFWAIHVEKAGTYEIALRRWPAELDLPINASLEPGLPVPGLTAFRETPGRSIQAHCATLMLAGQSMSKPVEPEDHDVRFLIELPEGDTDMEAEFTTETGAIGAYFAIVTRIQ